MVEVCGSRIRVIEQGSGDRAVLLVHGVGGWAEQWAETMDRIAASGRRAIAFDLPGFGESPPVRGARYFQPDRPFYAAVVEGICAALDLEGPHLVGHSLGGGIAAVTAVSHPQAFRSLTLVAPGGFGPDIALFLRLLSLPFLGLTTWLPRPKSLARGVLESCFDDRARIPAHLYAENERYGRTHPETLRVMRAVATLRGVRPGLRAAWLARAGEYQGPVCVVWGREDGIVPVAQLHALQQSYPEAETVTIASAGHLVMAEQPDRFAAALLRFLDRAERDTTDARTMTPGVADQER